VSDLQSAIDQFPISAWLSKHTQTHDDGTGADFYADCPICGGKRKLGVSRTKKLAHCFRCREGGHGAGTWNGAANLPKLIKLLEGCSWRDSFKLIYELSGLPEPEFVPDKRRDRDRRLPSDSYPLGRVNDGEPVIQFLRHRGVEHLRDTCYLCLENGRYYERLIIPTNQAEEWTGFEAKAIHSSQKPKSLYPEWMQTSESVYTVLSWSPDRTLAAVTESVLDAETVALTGVNAVGIYGSSFKDGQIRALLELGIETLVWMLDGDAWGAQKKAIFKSLGLFEHYVAPVPKGEDPNSLRKGRCEQAFELAVPIKSEWDLMEVAMEWEKGL
jgi:hypothetical protein